MGSSTPKSEVFPVKELIDYKTRMATVVLAGWRGRLTEPDREF